MFFSSTTCSTDSAGSSLSIDEYDSSHCLTPVSEHHSLHNSLIPSEPPISEEDAQTDDYLSMSPTNSSIGNQSSGVRSSLNLSFRPTSASNVSPITSPTFGTSKSTAQSIKEDMSPYLPMSPVGSVTDTESRCSSRRSSGLEKHLNIETQSSSEYMPMMSSQEIKSNDSEEYLNMAPMTQSLSEMTNPLSVNKEEYHLDKVKSYFAPLDENDSFDFMPPVRAYSIGSQPKSNIKRVSAHSSGRGSRQLPKSGTQTPETESEIRIRAFSMGHANGREAKLAAKKQQMFEEQIGGPTAPIEEVSKNSNKALSAPVISLVQPRKRSATVGSRPVFSRTALTSADKSDTDLMEIDYSKQSTYSREKIEDRIKRNTAATNRQRSNSRSSTSSSSGFGSTSTTSPSMTSSMSELTDKKRDISGTHSLHKSVEENQNSSLRSLPSGRDPNTDVTIGQTTNETKLPLSQRPNTNQVSQHLPTVPSNSTHSSTAVQQSQSQKLPTIETKTTKTETIAQKSDKNSTKTQKNEDRDGDYVCLDMRSTASVPQTTSPPVVSQSLPNSSSGGEPSDQKKSVFKPKKHDYIKIKAISEKSENLSETLLKSLAAKQQSVETDCGDFVSNTTQVMTQTMASNKPIIIYTKNTPIVTIEKSDSLPIPTSKTDNCSENSSLSSGSGSGSRPSSVSSNKELNYASLDLAPTPTTVSNTDLNDEHKGLPQTSAKCMPMSTPPVPLISFVESQELVSCCPLKYAEIDFGGMGDKKNTKS